MDGAPTDLNYADDSSLIRVGQGIDVAPLLHAIEAQPGLWDINTWRQNEAGGQQDTKAIMLRWAAENSFESVRDSVSCVNMPIAEQLPEAIPILDEALAAVGALELGRVFIVKLKSGGRVYPHSDVGMYADKFERFHICLQAGPLFEYFVQHPTGPIQFCNMEPGDLWWFNHKRTHWAHNGDTAERISIVLDCVAPKWKRKRDILAIGVGYQYQGGDNAPL